MLTIASIIAGIGTILGLGWKFYSSLTGKKADPTAQELQGDDQKNADALAQQETANAVDTKSDAARIAADDDVVRVLASPGIVNPVANAAIAKQFPSEFGGD